MFTEITVYDDFWCDCTDGEDNTAARELAVELAKQDNQFTNENDIYVLRVDDGNYIFEFFPEESVVPVCSGTL